MVDSVAAGFSFAERRPSAPDAGTSSSNTKDTREEELPEQRAYNHYLQVYLPERGEIRPHAFKPHTQAYKIGFEYWKKNMQGWEPCKDQALGISMDEDLTRTCGAIPPVTRCESAENSAMLASCALAESGKRFYKASGCVFELLQKDVVAFPLEDGRIADLYLLSCTLRSNKGMIKSAAVQLVSAECDFLAIHAPPWNATFVSGREADGSIILEGSTAGQGIFLGHQSCGQMQWELENKSTALIKLLPIQGLQESGCLSAELFVCLPSSPKLMHDMSVSVEACISADSGGLFKSGKKDKWVKVNNKRFQTSVMPL